jgi:5'(3')-deoxyribonucleotidase
MRKIYLDMDGTIADLYGVENWLEDLIAGNERPYREAERLVEEEELAELVADGYELAIVSWLAKNSNKEYDRKVRNAKREWLKENYPNIKFTEIHIVKYGTPKSRVVNERGILVDDEIPNRREWKGVAVDPKIFF